VREAEGDYTQGKRRQCEVRQRVELYSHKPKDAKERWQPSGAAGGNDGVSHRTSERSIILSIP